ncbi:MAG: hypothetical protein CMJ70_22510 [Planctomycetaceae bacterium]|nr:hypothetical protein [Planctomycetaceae bacterium]
MELSRIQRRLLAVRFALSVLIFLQGQKADTADNLLTDPNFRRVHELQLELPDLGWYWQRIHTPCQVTTTPDSATVTLAGGTVFLDSAPRSLAPATQHQFQTDVAGNATFSIELLAWKPDGLPAAPHRMVLHKAAPLLSGTHTLRVTFRKPADMSLAQIRLVAAQGTAMVHAPALSVRAATLLLSLDAAKPGPRPTTHWRDLSGRNGDFTIGKGVRYAADRPSYVFAAGGARCCGARQDSAAFDFETDTAAGPGNGDPFTVVFYAKLTDGLSGPGIVNKLASSQQRGWSVGLIMDEFGLDRVTTFQQSNREQRTINGFPGLAGQSNARLNVKDGHFHCFIVHFTGSGQRDGSVYIDGSKEPLPLVGWPFGALSSGSIRNTAPLCIGAFGEHGFRGEIGFVEIWSGTRLGNGLTPAEYSSFRYRNGNPRRGS